MARPDRVLALVLAGGSGSRLKALTENRGKPVVPFMGTYRLIDFALSNCMHSGLSDVWVLEQYLPHSLNDHLANGRPWDLDRTYGGLQVLPPYQGEAEEGFADGNADALYRHLRFLRDFGPKTILTLSADHIMRIDLAEVMQAHDNDGLDVTAAVTELPGQDVSRFAVVQEDAGRITRFDYKPQKPEGCTVAIEVFAFRAKALLDTLEELANSGPLKDYGDRLLPHLVQQGKAGTYRFGGYWQDVGTVESYWQTHMDLLSHRDRLRLDSPEWPILSLGEQRIPAYVDRSSRVEDSLLSPGCEVYGTVLSSVIGPGVKIERGAVVENAVLLEDAVIQEGAVVRHAVVDDGVRIGGRLEGRGGEVALSEPGPRRHLRSLHRPLNTRA